MTEDPSPGRAFLDFYSAGYLERRGDAKYGGQYRRVRASQPAQSDGTASWRIVYDAGADRRAGALRPLPDGAVRPRGTVERLEPARCERSGCRCIARRP